MAERIDGEIIACHECDHVYRYQPVPPGATASCLHCGAVLYKSIPNSLDRSLALYITSLMLFFIANAYPFLSLKLGGRVEENILLSSGLAMYKLGMGEVGLLIFLTSLGFPFLVMVGMIYLLLPLRFGHRPAAMGPVYRIVNAVMPWSLVSVFMLGVLISLVKLQDLATVIPGISLYALAALLVIFAAARANFDPRILWVNTRYSQPDPSRAQKLLNCHTCALVTDADQGSSRCPRCTTPLHYRKPDSLHRTWALLLTAAILIIPANLYPVMTVVQFGRGDPNTILSGVLHLIEGGMWGLAMIVFVASIVIPGIKLLSLSYLLVSVQKGSAWRPRDRTLLYRITEGVGAWSMVDVFLVGVLSALVSLDALTTITPGIGVSYFAGVVIITMFAAHFFDPRLIWDHVGNSQTRMDEQ